MICFHEIEIVLNANRSVKLCSTAHKQAAVALIIDGTQSERDPKVVFIQRALNENDPWSGQMALPGGRCEPEDSGPLETACRETLEEIGLDLSNAKIFGRLDDLQGRHGGRSKNMAISCFVFGVQRIEKLFPNHEVADIISIPISALLDPEAKTEINWHSDDRVFPGICVGDGKRIIWGLTYRFLSQFFSLLGHSLPSESD